jgi:hypothetical protein
MKALTTGLGLAWLVMAVVGCAGGSSLLIKDDRSGQLSVEHDTGRVAVRRGTWGQRLQTGKLKYRYGEFIEEPRK